MKDHWFILFNETQLASQENLWKAAENKDLSLLLSFHLALLSVLSKVYSFYSSLNKLRVTGLNNCIVYIYMRVNWDFWKKKKKMHKDRLNFCDILPKNWIFTMASDILIWQLFNICSGVILNNQSELHRDYLNWSYVTKRGMAIFKWKYELLCYHIACIIKSQLSLYEAQWRLPEIFLLQYNITIPAR